MGNLKQYSDLFAGLSQTAYTNRPNNFSETETWNHDQLEAQHYGSAIPFDFSKRRGGSDLGESGKVYLQPDKTGSLTDKNAGYNSYFVTDKPSVKDSKETYFVNRGSDSYENLHDLWTDWIKNDIAFAVASTHIPQAKLATAAMHEKIKELPDGAVMNVTGHSLGTMVSIQGVANLSPSDIDKIGRVVLFQGPDARSSIEKMSKQARENIEKLEAQGKIDYYVNPFDIVSMLNRNKKGVDEIGKVHYLLPLSATTTFDMAALNGSSHDFGQYQFNKDGNIREANVKDNPEIFEAGVRLSRLIDETMAQMTSMIPLAGATGIAILQAISSGGTNVVADIIAASGGKLTVDQAKKLYDDFMDKYNGIIKDTAKSMRRNTYISNLKSRISRSSGGERIKLRSELVAVVSEESKTYGQEYETLVKNCQRETEDEIDQLVQEVQEGAHGSATYLSYFEVEEMIQSFHKDRLWDNRQAADNIKETKKYKEKLGKFSRALKNVSKNIQTYDGAAGKSLFEAPEKAKLAPWDLHF